MSYGAFLRAPLTGISIAIAVFSAGCRSSPSAGGADDAVQRAPTSQLDAGPAAVGTSTGGFQVESAGVAAGDAGPNCTGSGDPSTSVDGGATCTGILAQSTFTHAVCSCGTLTASSPFVTDGFNSNLGPPDGGGGGNVGTDSFQVWSNGVTIGGDLATPGNLNASSPGTVRGSLFLGGTAQVGSFTVDGNASLVQPRPSGLHVLGTTTHVASVAPPCDCSNLVPVANIVAAHRPPANDDSTLGLSSTALTGANNPARIDLPCGNYYLTQISINSGPVTIAAHGHTALYVDGNISVSQALTFQIDPTASLDLFVAGTVSASAPLTLGSTAHPAHCRAYVAGSSVTLSQTSAIACNVYAPKATIGSTAPPVMYGSFFVGGFTASAATTIHYDRAIQSAGGECCTPATCDDGNPCTVDACNGDGTCSHTPAPNGTSCTGTNKCEQTFTCQAGACVGSNPVVCTAQDACHVAGTCNPSTGTCSNPTAPDGTTCDDGNGCTQTDACKAGVCTGSNPITCTASDQCHVAGICNPSTGTCSNPAAANGTTCDDGNACTQSDSCQSGTCTGSNPIVCVASDPCHVAGTCSPTTGVCSNPPAANGTTCDDGNACTQSDSCQSGACTGSNPVTCTAQDACHVAGTCNPSTGICSNPNAGDGTPCTGTNKCNQSYACVAGTCTGSNPVTCTASDPCHVAGTCNPGTGACSNPAAPNGTACDDGNACTQTDACQNGTCTGSNPVTCAAPSPQIAATAPMSAGRSQHTATKLPSGNVLVAGGTSDHGTTALATVETFSVSGATWSSTAPMESARFGHTATLLASGKVLVAGGTGLSGAATSSTEVYDPSTNTWTAAPPMNAARSGGLAVALTSGQVLVVGGASAGGVASEVFDPTAGTWAAATSTPASAGLGGTIARMADGRVLVAGGTDTSGAATSAATVYDPATGAWSSVAPMPTARAFAVATLLPTGSVIVAGGNALPATAALADAVIYTPATDTWTAAPPMSAGRTTAASASLPDGRFVVEGGGALGADLFDPFAQSWSPVASSAIRSQATATLTGAGTVLLAGGVDGGGNTLATADLFSASSAQCTQTSCNPQTGQCSTTNKTDGTACNDGDVCLQTQTCAGGFCVGSNPVQCASPGLCQAGLCDPKTGSCLSVPVSDGTACSDGNLCTTGEACKKGACTGTPVVCAPPDQCHAPGTCNPTTGVCSYVALADGTACDDGNACTQTDACVSGVCSGSNLVTCTASDACHVAGTCNPATGACSNPAASDGTACTGSNPCNQTYACVAGSCTGSNPVTCTASDACHVAGTCNPATGACSNPAAADGTVCTGSDLCNQTYACVGGACTGSNPVTCKASDQCHVAGTCDSSTGACSNPAASNGTACNDGNACTTGDACQAGACAGTATNVDDGNPCTADSCNPVTGTVSHVPTPGAACASGGGACQGPGTCSAAGVCQGANLPAGTPCPDSEACNGTETCDGAGKCKAGTPLPDGQDCAGSVCTPSTCSAGRCVAGTPLPDGSSCADGSACRAGATCLAGACNASANDGDSCSDGDVCNGVETCKAGACARGTPVAPLSAPGDLCHSDLCDPITGAITQVTCTPINRTAPTDLFQASAFIIAQQPGAVIDPKRITVLRGSVVDTSGNALPNVTISVAGDTTPGNTRTRLDGHFDMAINGGGALRLRYGKPGYLPVERPLPTHWKEYGHLPDVVLTPLDPPVTPISVNSASFQVARGSFVKDVSGVRQATVLFPPGTAATFVFPDGTQTPFTGALSVRATEFTVGPSGPNAMPGALPATSAYTYAVELSADEARAVGAKKIVFSDAVDPTQPRNVLAYVDNFLGFRVSDAIPSGYYDNALGGWVPMPNGRVVQILSVSGGQVTLATQLDSGGNPVHNDADEAALGITPGERVELASLYVAGQTLWRVPLPQLADPDFNLPAVPPSQVCALSDPTCQPPDPSQPGATSPGPPPDTGGAGGGGSPPPGNPDDPCEKKGGSIIRCQGQVLLETIPLAGTPYTLNYASDRAAGRVARERSTLSIPLVGPTTPPGVLRIELDIDVAGRHFTPPPIQCPCSGTAPYLFTWDGTDGFGRVVQGQQPIRVDIAYVYPGRYVEPGESEGAAFGAYGITLGPISTIQNPAAGELSFVKHWTGTVGGWNERGAGLGGWSLDVHHVYDPAGRVLYTGDGRHRSTAAIRPSIHTVPAPSTGALSRQGMVATSDGSVYFTDSPNSRVRRLDPSGVVTTVAQVPFPGPLAHSAGGDGSFYVSSLDQTVSTSGSQVYRIDSTGHVTLFAGDGTTCPRIFPAPPCGDGGPATSAQLTRGIHLLHMTVAADGTVYIADDTRIRRVGLDGIITTIAGNGADRADADPTDDGQPATQVPVGELIGILAAPDGNVYWSDGSFIRFVRPDGTIATLAGSVKDPSTAATVDGLLAKNALISATELAMSRDGLLLFSDNSPQSVRQIGSDGVLTSIQAVSSSAFTGPFPFIEGMPATATPFFDVGALAFAPDGTLLVAANGGILRIDSSFPGFAVATLAIPSADGTEVYGFDTTGRHLETVDALTGAVKYTFAYETDPATGQLGRLASVTYAPGTSHVTTFSYDDASATSTVTSPFGDTTALGFDTSANLASVSRQGGPASAPRVETYTLVTTPDGLLTSFSDPNGTLAGQPHSLAYDVSANPPTGRLTSDSDPVGGNQSLALSVAPTTSGSASLVTRSVRGDGQTYANTYEVGYDTAGNEIRVDQSATATNPTTTTIAKDGSRVATLPDGTVITTTLTPDPRFGLLSPTTSTTTTLPLGGLSRVEAVKRTLNFQKGLHEVDSINGFSFTTDYDPTQRIVTRNTPAGRTSTTQFDAQGRVSVETEQGFGSTSFAYTPAFGQLATTTRHASGELDRVVQNAYYAPGAGLGFAGNVASVTDPLGNATSFDVYDRAGRVLHETLAGARPVGFAYDANGNQVEVDPPPATSALGSGQALQAQHLFGFTSIDQLATYQVHDQAGAANTFLETTSYGYTPDRLLKALLRPEGDQLSYTNTRGRLDNLGLPGGENVAYSYDPASGQLQGITGPMGVGLAFAYNGALLTDVTWSGLVSGALHRDYDNNFRVLGETAQGIPLFFDYDADGLLQCVGTNAQSTAQSAQGFGCPGGLGINFAPGTSLLHSTTFPFAAPAPISESYTPNGYGEMLHYHASAGGQSLYTTDFTRDVFGRLATKSEALLNADATTSTASFTYTYDAAGRLTDVVTGGGTLVHYDYDLNGNRLRRSLEAPGANSEELGAYGVGDQLQTYAGKTYHYTASGVLHDVSDASGTTTYAHDALGNLRTVVLPSNTTIDYVIDGQNRRIGKKVGGQLVKAWLYEDALRIAAEVNFDGKGNVTGAKRFGYGSKVNVPDLMVLQDGTRYRILSDHLGSPRMVVAESGNTIVARMDYDEFGRVLGNTQPGMLPFGFAGGLYDPDTGIVRFGGRDYDAVTGRWIAKDPIRFAGGDTNLYNYVGAEPLNRIDPRGESPDSADCKECLQKSLAKFLKCNESDCNGGNSSVPPACESEPAAGRDKASCCAEQFGKDDEACNKGPCK
jgi:RHS repeat-associated protein